MTVRIPAKKNLIPLNFEYVDDTIDQYYRPIQGYFMRKRLDLALTLFANDILHLDVGDVKGRDIENLFDDGGASFWNCQVK